MTKSPVKFSGFLLGSDVRATLAAHHISVPAPQGTSREVPAAPSVPGLLEVGQDPTKTSGDAFHVNYPSQLLFVLYFSRGCLTSFKAASQINDIKKQSSLIVCLSGKPGPPSSMQRTAAFVCFYLTSPLNSFQLSSGQRIIKAENWKIIE